MESGTGTGVSTMHRADEYRRHAAECVLLAAQSTDPGNKDSLRAMALAWEQLADLAERNDRSGPNYETPPAHPTDPPKSSLPE